MKNLKTKNISFNTFHVKIYYVLRNGHAFETLIFGDPHSTVIFREYFENIPLKCWNIASIFIKLLEGF